MNQASKQQCQCGAPICQEYQKDSKEFLEGYQAQAKRLSMVYDNPYPDTDSRHWDWRKGFLQAYKDSH